jgi:small subunit ribosomal protein S6
MIRRYEMMYILDSSQSDEDIQAQVTKIEEMVTSTEGGETIEIDRWGKKRLAYEIKGKQFGYYVVFEFQADAEIPKVIDRYCRLENTVVRHMLLVIPDRILNLKKRQEELKTSLELRRKTLAEKTDDSAVVDMLKEKGEIEEDAPVAVSTPEAAPEAAPEVAPEAVVEVKAEEAADTSKDAE